MADIDLDMRLWEALNSLNNEHLSQRDLRKGIQEIQQGYHVHFNDQTIHQMYAGNLGKILNTASHGNIRNYVHSIYTADGDAGDRLTHAFGADPSNAQGGQGGGAQQLLSTFQQAGQQGMQAMQQVPQALQGLTSKLKPESLFKPFQDLSKTITDAVKSATHGGAGGGHDTDDSGHDADHQGGDHKTEENREKTVHVNAPEGKKFTVTLNPQGGANPAPGGATGGTGVTPESHPTSSSPAPISAGLVTNNTGLGDPTDAGSGASLGDNTSDTGLTSPTIEDTSDAGGDVGAHDTETDAAVVSRSGQWTQDKNGEVCW